MNADDFGDEVRRIKRLGSRDGITATVKLLEALLAEIANETGAAFALDLPSDPDPAFPGTVPTSPGRIALRCHFNRWALWFTPDGAGGAVQRLVEARFTVRQCFLARSQGPVAEFMAAAAAARAAETADAAGDADG